MKPSLHHPCGTLAIVALAAVCHLFLAQIVSPASAQNEKAWEQRAERLRQKHEQTIANRRDSILEFARQQRDEHEAMIERARRVGIPVETKNAAGEVVGTLEGFTASGLPIYTTSEADTSAMIINTKPLWNYPWNLDGSSQEIGLWEFEGRPLETHDEFGGPNFSRVDWRDDTTPPYDDHATHVAGIMIAEGVQPRAHGMAPAANLYGWDSADDLGEMSNAAVSPGIELSNHSYGIQPGWECFGGVGASCAGGIWRWWGDKFVDPSEAYLFGFYHDIASDWDALIDQDPYYLAVKAAGNEQGEGPSSQPVTHQVRDAAGNWTTVQGVSRDVDCEPAGYDCLAGAGVAKNVLVVGALKDDGTTPASFTSFGPTDDGRIKPDLMANGTSVYSAFAGGNTAYGTMSGTSMAAPAVTGSIALLKDLSGIARYHAATLKGLVLHTADDIGADGPDYKTGWGRMNTEAAAEVLEEEIAAGDPLHVVDNTVLEGGETLEFGVTTETTSEPLRVTIAWTDPPGFPPPDGVDRSDRMLLNDLDLRVIRDATSFVEEPYVLDPSNPSAEADPGDNDVDNVEQVYIPSPASNESYTLRVTHEGALAGPSLSQDFALVVTGNSSLTLPDDHDDGGGGGDCELPTTISADYTVDGACKVDGTTVTGGATLTLEPGATLEFKSGASLTVEPGARILAEGTAANAVGFKAKNNNNWKKVVARGDGSRFEHVEFRNSGVGCSGSCPALLVEAQNVAVSHAVSGGNMQDNAIEVGPTPGGQTGTLTLSSSTLTQEVIVEDGAALDGGGTPA